MAGPDTETVHATCVAIDGAGVLLVGPSGAGKSDLVLRLIDADRPALPTRLVGDDYVMVTVDAGRLIATPPPAIAGRLEVRGVGIVAVPYASEAAVALVVDLVDPADVPRLPERSTVTICGVDLPRLKLAPFEPSAPAKVRAALRAIIGDGFVEGITGG